MPQSKAQNSASSMQGQKSVFRVPNYRSQTLTHGSTDDPSDRVYHSRRSHRKSRAGCTNCKQRRVKVPTGCPVIQLTRPLISPSVMSPNPTVCAARNMVSTAAILLCPPNLNLKRPSLVGLRKQTPMSCRWKSCLLQCLGYFYLMS